MKAIIFNTQEEAEALNNELTESVKHLFDEHTTNYSYVHKHPLEELFCIPISENDKYWNEISKKIETYKLDNLSSDWFNSNII